MNILFDIGHPAHVHLFKNFIQYLIQQDHNVVVVTRDKDITSRLLEYYGIEFKSLSKPGNGLFGMAIELLSRDYQIFKLHWKYKFHIAIGTSISIGHLSFISQVKSFNFNEDDDDVVPLFSWLSYPFSNYILNPDCIDYSRWKSKRVLYPSYHELAYLHPKNFTPDTSILDKYNLEKKKYIVVRLSALKAHHDLNAKGIPKPLWSKIQNLIGDYQIVKSVENEKTHRIDPWDMHHLLSFAKMIISDSQTMTIEGGILGIPSIRINTFIDKSTVISELEKQYNLAMGFFPEDEDNIINTIDKLLRDPSLEDKWDNKRKQLLKDKIDLNKWMVDFFEDEIRP